MRLLSLDVLRGVAVLLVLLCHTSGIPGHSPLLEPFNRGGGAGVDLFFVLSGFLVSGLLFQGQDWKRFLVRRSWKLYPAFWVLIAVSIVQGYRTIDWGTVANELLFVQNYRPAIWGHTWSLAVEEHFYLTLPFILMIVPRRLLTFLAASALVLCTELRCLELPAIANIWDQHEVHTHIMQTHLRFDALLLGVALRYWFQDDEFVKFCCQKAVFLGVTGVAMLLPTFVIGSAGPQIAWLITLKALGSACLVAALVARGVPENRVTKGLGFIGKHSYSIYLWHALPACLVLQHLSGWTAVAVYLSWAIIGGIQLARLIELPALALRDKKWSGRRAEGAYQTAPPPQPGYSSQANTSVLAN